MSQSWKPEVRTDLAGKWYGNALPLRHRAEGNAQRIHDLAMRWYAVQDYRAVPSDDPVNYSYVTRTLEPVTHDLQEDADVERRVSNACPRRIGDYAALHLGRGRNVPLAVLICRNGCHMALGDHADDILSHGQGLALWVVLLIGICAAIGRLVPNALLQRNRTTALSVFPRRTEGHCARQAPTAIGY